MFLFSVRKLSVIAGVFILTAILFAAGCGGGATTKSAAAYTPGVSQQKPLPALGLTNPAERPAPYGKTSTLSQSVGITIDGIQLKQIRWSDHGTFFRIVFDMATPNGQPLLQIPHAEASMTPDKKQIRVMIDGIRSVSSSPTVKAQKVQIGDSLVTSMTRESAKDDQSRTYDINLSRPSSYALAGLGSPGRIVIDILK